MDGCLGPEPLERLRETYVFHELVVTGYARKKTKAFLMFFIGVDPTGFVFTSTQGSL